MAQDPFEIPQIVLPKLTPEKFMEMLRETFCTGYMPSSVKSGYNTKLEYRQHVNEWCSRESGYFPGIGTYVEIDSYGHSSNDATIWAFVDGGPTELACNLKTDEIFVRAASDEHGPWYVFDKPLPVDMDVLKDKLDWM